MNNSLFRFWTVVLAGTSVACATAAPVEPVATPMAARVDTVVVEATPEIEPLEPGRFDMGKMWTFENAPIDYFQEAYGFRPTADWLAHARLASLRLPNCTASFVSADGLVMSNHHCAREPASDVTREGEDLLTNGFYAASLDEERRVPDLWLDQLVETQDITELIESAVDDQAPEAAQVRARDARVGFVEDSASTALGLRCSATALYQGGKYSLYCFKRFEDVRLVFVPELQIGYFGGDYDNFTYPRYVLDVSFFRVYDENGEPYHPAEYYGWSTTGAQAGDAVFVIGNPGSTERLSTVAQLESDRDFREPFTVRLLETRTDILAQYMEHHPETRPQYINQWFGWMNSLKLYRGRLKALQDPTVMGRKLGFENQFRKAVQGDPVLAARYGTLWDEIAGIRDQMAEVYPTLLALNFSGSTRSQTLATASEMVQYAQAVLRGVPDSLTGPYRDQILEREIDARLDRHLIEAQIEDVASVLGDDDPFVVEALGESSESDAAMGMIDGSPWVSDVDARRALLDSPSAVLQSDNLAISLVRDALPRLATAAQTFQRLSNAEEVRSARLARALFEVYRTSLPPDATFTLRIADGVVENYEYNGTLAPVSTTFYGMYDRHYSHEGMSEWALPDRWLNPPADFDMSTPLNMVSTNDITGGNSGSPVINRDLEIVGLIFDSNIEGLSGDFIYTDEVARSVSVRSEAIAEALEHIYGAERIAQELVGR